jgi:Arc/MetJ-type ribon-helix-helix transcriptional regulator
MREWIAVGFVQAKAEAKTMKVEQTPDAAQWVETAVATGRFMTPEDAVRFAVNRAKGADLAAMLAASEAEGGSHGTEDAKQYVKDHLDRLSQTARSE